MDADRPTAAADAAPPLAAYCRRCGYSLRGLQSGQCPECGGAFDLADRKTFARRPPRVRLRWWAWRVAAVLSLLALAAASVPGWYWWQWRAERGAIEEVKALGGFVRVRRAEAAGLARLVPERWAFLRDRAYDVVLKGLTAEQAGRVDLRPLARVTNLSLTECHVGDPMLAQIGGLTELKVLDLEDASLSGSRLAHVAECRRLEHLSLYGARLTDADLVQVGRLVTLTGLDVHGEAVTDAGVAHLAGLTSLEYLDLTYTAVTDAGLLQLRGLTSLQDLGVRGSRVTEQGKRELKRALANVRIY